MPSKKRFIAVAGNIGAGKSELVAFLCRRYGLKPFFEPDETNPYLADFYKDMKAWAFHSQIYFLARKLRIYGIEPPGAFRKFVCGRKLWNYDNLEPAERKLVL